MHILPASTQGCLKIKKNIFNMDQAEFQTQPANIA